MPSSGSGSAASVVTPIGTYPTGDDLTTYLTSLGIVATDAAMTALNLDVKAAAASSAWETQTRWKPFLSAPGTRYFDAPGLAGGTNWGAWMGGRRRLFLEGGLLSVTSVTINLTLVNTTGLDRTLNYDYWLRPQTAPYESEPYTFVEFRAPVYGEPNSVKIVGSWGYATAVPDDAWQAILQYGALLTYPELSLGISKGLYSMRDLNFEIRYGGAGLMPLALEMKQWQAVWNAALLNYRRPLIV